MGLWSWDGFINRTTHSPVLCVFLPKDTWFNNTFDWLTWNSQPAALELMPERSWPNTRIFSVSTSQPSCARQHCSTTFCAEASRITNKKGKIVKNGHQVYLWKNPSLLYETWNMKAERDLVGPQLGTCASVNPTLLLLCACPGKNVETLRVLTLGLQVNSCQLSMFVNLKKESD